MAHQPNLSEKSREFLSRYPTLIGIVAGSYYYEHPTLGDESRLIVISPDGKKSISEFWELPD